MPLNLPESDSPMDEDDEDLDDETGEADPEWYPIDMIAPGLSDEFAEEPPAPDVDEDAADE